MRPDVLFPAPAPFDVRRTINKVKQDYQTHLMHLRLGLKQQIELGRQLTLLKQAIGHGSWAAFLADNFAFSLRTSQRWMSTYETSLSAEVETLSLDQMDQLEEAQKRHSVAFEPTPVSTSGQSSTTSVKPPPKATQREPGDDSKAEGEFNPFARSLATIKGKVELFIRTRKVQPPTAEEASRLVSRATEVLPRLAQAPFREPPAEPKRKKCRRCGQPVLLVVSEKSGKWFTLDPEPRRGGRFDLRGGLAVAAEGSDLYWPHAVGCPNPRKQ